MGESAPEGLPEIEEEELFQDDLLKRSETKYNPNDQTGRADFHTSQDELPIVSTEENQDHDILIKAAEAAQQKRIGNIRRHQPPSDIDEVTNKGLEAQRVRLDSKHCMRRVGMTRGSCPYAAYPVVAEAREPSFRCESLVSNESQTWEEMVEEANRRGNASQRLSFQSFSSGVSQTTSPRNSTNGSSAASSDINNDFSDSPIVINFHKDRNGLATPSIHSNDSKFDSFTPSKIPFPATWDTLGSNIEPFSIFYSTTSRVVDDQPEDLNQERATIQHRTEDTSDQRESVPLVVNSSTSSAAESKSPPMIEGPPRRRKNSSEPSSPTGNPEPGVEVDHHHHQQQHEEENTNTLEEEYAESNDSNSSSSSPHTTTSSSSLPDGDASSSFHSLSNTDEQAAAEASRIYHRGLALARLEGMNPVSQPPQPPFEFSYLVTRNDGGGDDVPSRNVYRHPR